MTPNYSLYTKETNREPRETSLNDWTEILAVAGFYRLEKPESILILSKQNPASGIYKYISDAGCFIIRSATTDCAEVLESQCKIVSRLVPGISLMPLKSLTVNYVSKLGGKCWICYPWVAGKQFSGDVSLLNNMLSRACELSESIDYTGRLVPGLESLPTVHYPTTDWHLVFKWLSMAPLNNSHSMLLANVPKGLLEMLLDHQVLVDKIIEPARDLQLKKSVVHYDLQHANVLINSDSKVVFIDLEDIYWSDSRIALCHGVFKWARHCIYCAPACSGEVRVWLKNSCLCHLNEFFGQHYTLKDIGFFALFRTVSDLYVLMNNVISRGQTQWLYDIEKKFSNLLEIIDLFELDKDE